MRRVLVANMILASILAAPASAGVVLLANGTLTGSSAGANTDLSGLAGTLENGLPANILGGLGSGLTYAGGNTFLAVPDRGPNATPYNSGIDDTVSYISRFQTVDMQLTANGGSGLPFTLTPTLTNTTLLSSSTPLGYGSGAGLGNKKDGTPLGSGAPAQNSAGTYYFTGRSDNYDPSQNSGNPANARFDPESIRVSADGKNVFISDEYGPYIREFDRTTGKLVKTFALPDSGAGNLDVTTLGPTTASETGTNNTSGRVANKGMEGLALTPDGKTLVGIMQAPLIQDAADPATANMLRIVTVDIATGVTHEYGYMLTNGSGVSDIVALNDHQFLVDERDGKGLGDGSKAKVKQIFEIDLAGATDISNLSGAAAAAAAVNKPTNPFLDLVQLLGDNGISKSDVPSKIEGISFGEDVTYNGQDYHTLWIANDNDFTPDTSGPNQFYVVGFQDSDLPGYSPERFTSGVPEPASWAMMVAGFGLMGAALRRRRTTVRFA